MLLRGDGCCTQGEEPGGRDKVGEARGEELGGEDDVHVEEDVVVVVLDAVAQVVVVARHVFHVVPQKVLSKKS